MAEKTAKTTYIEAIGRRKTSVARVRFYPEWSKQSFIVNDKNIEQYFPLKEMIMLAKRPLSLDEKKEKYQVSVRVKGGGLHSQCEAVSQGLSKALVKYNAAIKPILKKANLLTRDARIKERRKFGLKKARKAPQWSKR